MRVSKSLLFCEQKSSKKNVYNVMRHRPESRRPEGEQTFFWFGGFKFRSEHPLAEWFRGVGWQARDWD
jgi:hypothetical protein